MIRHNEIHILNPVLIASYYKLCDRGTFSKETVVLRRWESIAG